MNIKYKMVVDFARPHHSNTVLIQRTDDMSRELEFTLMNNGKEFDMAGVFSAAVQAVLPNGEYVYGDATIELDEEENKTNRVTYVVPLALTKTAGSVTISIVLQGTEGETITSFESYLVVRNVLYSSSDIDLDDLDLSGFRDLLNEAIATANSAWSKVSSLDALPNPYPIRITLDGTTYSYNGSELVEIEENLASKAWVEIEISTAIQKVMNGCTIYYRDGYFWATYGSVVKKLGDVSSLGLTAEASNVLAGKTFLGKGSANADAESVMTGTMPNHSGKVFTIKASASDKTIDIPAGYYDGAAKITVERFGKGNTKLWDAFYRGIWDERYSQTYTFTSDYEMAIAFAYGTDAVRISTSGCTATEIYRVDGTSTSHQQADGTWPKAGGGLWILRNIKKGATVKASSWAYVGGVCIVPITV